LGGVAEPARITVTSCYCLLPTTNRLSLRIECSARCFIKSCFSFYSLYMCNSCSNGEVVQSMGHGPFVLGQCLKRLRVSQVVCCSHLCLLWAAGQVATFELNAALVAGPEWSGRF